MIIVALILCVQCAPRSASPPAAPVPTHVLTLDKAGSITTAQQGDFIEVRLNEERSGPGRWKLSHQSGDGRIETYGPESLVSDGTVTMRVFRFKASGIGRVELSFSSGQRVATFRFDIR